MGGGKAGAETTLPGKSAGGFTLPGAGGAEMTLLGAGAAPYPWPGGTGTGFGFIATVGFLSHNIITLSALMRRHLLPPRGNTGGGLITLCVCRGF